MSPESAETSFDSPVDIAGTQKAVVIASGAAGKRVGKGAGKASATFDFCIICCEENPRYAAVGRCGHAEVCWVCAVRLRSLLHDTRCPICKEDLPEIAMAPNAASGLSMLASRAQPASGGSTEQGPAGASTGDARRRRSLIGPQTSASDPGGGAAGEPLLDGRLGILYSCNEIREEVEQLFDYTCSFGSCAETGRTFQTLQQLMQHLRHEHNREFCQTCLYNRKAFLHEQLLYRPEDMARHRREGDGSQLLGMNMPPIPAHAHCDFCRKYFYSYDDLLEHMHRKHHLCSLCERQGWRGEFFRDYAYLSLHYEERHYVCRHADCRRGPYMLTAFADEDELRMHDASVHSIQLSQKARKQGVRLNIQLGPTSYREEQERRRQQQGAPTATTQTRRGAAGTSAEVPLRFAWPRGQPARPSRSDESWRLDEDFGKDDDEAQLELFPPRGWRAQGGSTAGFAHHARAESRSQAPPAAVQQHVEQNVQVQEVRREEPRAAPSAQQQREQQLREQQRLQVQQECEAATANAEALQGVQALLEAALGAVEESGIDLVDHLEAPLYRERNRKFGNELRDAFGAEQIAEFKQSSADFRRALSDAAEADDKEERDKVIASYAARLLALFAAASGQQDCSTDSRAKLLSDLILLLPDKVQRESLHREVQRLRKSKRLEAAKAVAQMKALQRKVQALEVDWPDGNNAAAATASAPSPPAAPVTAVPSAGSAMSPGGQAPDASPPEFEAVPLSCALRADGSNRAPRFLAALDAMLAAAMAVAGEREARAATGLRLPALLAEVRRLDEAQAESLEFLQKHVSAAGGARLDFSVVERLQALRPLLLLKLQARSGKADSQATGWREWKQQAAAVVQTTGREELRAISVYVRMCLEHAGEDVRAGADPALPIGAPAASKPSPKPKGGGRGASSQAGRGGGAPAFSSPGARWAHPDRSSEVSVPQAQDFPVLGGGVASGGAAPPIQQEDDAGAQRGDKKRRQRQVLAAWG